MEGVMIAYAVFAGIVVLILLTAVIGAAIVAITRKLRGARERSRPPDQP